MAIHYKTASLKKLFKRLSDQLIYEIWRDVNLSSVVSVFLYQTAIFLTHRLNVFHLSFLSFSSGNPVIVVSKSLPRHGCLERPYGISAQSLK